MIGWVIAAATAAAIILTLRVKREPEAALPPGNPGESLEDFARRMSTLHNPEPAPDEAPPAWITCPVCACPTRERYCAVCEWEAELTEAGEDLAPRREFFREMGTVYSSFELAQWAGWPPSEEERALQREILEITARGRSGEVDAAEWWESFMDREDRLRRARADRVTALEGE